MFRKPMDTWTARLQRADFCKMSEDKRGKVMRYLDHYVDEAVHFVGEEVGVRWRGFGQSDGDDNEEGRKRKRNRHLTTTMTMRMKGNGKPKPRREARRNK